MTVSSEVSRISYNGNGVTTAFSTTFPFTLDGDITVILVDTSGVETTQTITTHYTVSGAGNPSSGTVTMLTPPASGERLIILRQLSITQETDWVDNDPLPMATIENAVDKLTYIAQQQQEELDRCVKITEGSLSDPSTLVSALEDGAAAVATVAVAAALLTSAPDGTAAAPALAFADDTNTGVYRSGTDELSISTGGVQRVAVGSAGATVTGAVSASTSVTAGTTVTASNATGQGTVVINSQVASGYGGFARFQSGAVNKAYVGLESGINGNTTYADLTLQSVSGAINFCANGSASPHLKITSAGALETGVSGVSGGSVKLYGSTSGSVTLGVPAAAGTTTFTLPSSNGTPGQYFQTNGSGVTSWVSGETAKCWGYVTGGGTPAIAASFNVTSIADTATGRLTVTIATDFAAVNYATVYGGEFQSGGSGIAFNTAYGTQAAGTIEINAKVTSSLVDPQTWSWAFFGAQ